MKKIIPVLLILLLMLCGCGKEENPDVETHTPETTLAETAAANPFDFADIHYSIQLPVYEIVQGDGVWEPTEYGDFVYDENGLLIQKTKLPAGTSVYTNEYDEQGRLVKETETHAYGSNINTYAYVEDDSHQYRTITEFHNRPGPGLVSMVKSQSFMLDGAVNTFHYEYQFDEFDRVIQLSYSNLAYGSKIVQDFEYGPEGRIVKEIQNSYMHGVLDDTSEAVMTYDGLGRLIREDFVILNDGYESSFTNVYGVSRYIELSTKIDETLLTTDAWESFPEENGIPMLHTCIQGISAPQQEADAEASTYTFYLGNDRENADLLIQKYLAILKDVCGFTWGIGEDSVTIFDGEMPKANIMTGTDPVNGCYLRIDFC